MVKEMTNCKYLGSMMTSSTKDWEYKGTSMAGMVQKEEIMDFKAQ